MLNKLEAIWPQNLMTTVFFFNSNNSTLAVKCHLYHRHQPKHRPLSERKTAKKE